MTFGWNVIINMWLRECERLNTGVARRVPKLLPSYIERDAWTKLNVAPAKIMQVSLGTKMTQTERPEIVERSESGGLNGGQRLLLINYFIINFLSLKKRALPNPPAFI